MVPCQPGVPCRVCTEKYGVVEFEVRSVAGMAQYSSILLRKNLTLKTANFRSGTTLPLFFYFYPYIPLNF